VNASFTQENKSLIAIGLNVERIDIPSEGSFWYNNGVTGDYRTKRERISVEALFRLYKRFKTASALGISFYDSELKFGRRDNPAWVGDRINSPNVTVSQKIMFDLIPNRSPKTVQFQVSPFVALDYEHFLGRRNRTGGFSDLFSEEAENLIANRDLPAVSTETKSPAGILSASAGLSSEIIFGNKIGVYYHIGALYSLFGSSQINAKYRYEEDKIYTVIKRSDADIEFVQRVGLRYYF
jgi:hypothetical protein